MIGTNKKTVGRLIKAEGEVLLKRKSWSDYCSTAVGAELYFGDLLHPAPGARVLVQCADNKTIWPVPNDEISGVTQGCPPQLLTISNRSGKMIAPRGEINPLIPYIISPRRTSLLTAQPIIRWNPVPGATLYTISIIDEEEELLWEAEVNGSEVVYPGNPALQPEVDYILLVEADTGSSSQEEDMPDIGFSLLDENKSQQVREALKELTAQDLTEEAASFAQTFIYTGFGLRAEAIETLETMVKNGSQTAAVYRVLGNLYWQLGLNQLAEIPYMKAFELVSATDDLEGKAAVAAGLGKIYEAIGNQQQAQEWLTKARNQYEVLGDTEWIREIEKQLNQLTQ